MRGTTSIDSNTAAEADIKRQDTDRIRTMTNCDNYMSDFNIESFDCKGFKQPFHCMSERLQNADRDNMSQQYRCLPPHSQDESQSHGRLWFGEIFEQTKDISLDLLILC